MSGPDRVLSTKPALMSSPGAVYSQLYVQEENASVEWLENTGNWSNTLGLSSKSFGSSSQIMLPNDQFLSHVVLRLQLKPLRPGEMVPQGWGLAALQSTSWIMGASSATSIVLQGDSIAQLLLSQASTAEARLELLELAGQAMDGSVLIDGNAQVPEALIVLPLPFSGFSDHIKPVDSTMITNNISINVIFNQAGAFYGGATAAATPQTEFAVAEVLLHQFKLGDQSASIRSKMIADANVIYNLPVVHAQSFTSPAFTGSNVAAAPCDVLLQSFANADLLGIVFHVIELENKVPAAGKGPRNPFLLDDISNIEVSFNGTTLFRLPGKSHHLTSMLTQTDGAASYGYTKYDYVDDAKGYAVAPGGQVKCYPIHLDFTQQRAAFQHEHMNNTWRIPNQSIQLRFNTTKNVQYRVAATYLYNMSISYSNGISSLILA